MLGHACGSEPARVDAFPPSFLEAGRGLYLTLLKLESLSISYLVKRE